MGWGLAGTGNSSAVAAAVVVAPQGGWVGGKEVFFQEKKPPEAACWPDAGLLKRKGIFDKYRDVQKMMPIWPSDSYGFASGKRDRPPIPPSL